VYPVWSSNKLYASQYFINGNKVISLLLVFLLYDVGRMKIPAEGMTIIVQG
jgi:hypothetical protein